VFPRFLYANNFERVLQLFTFARIQKPNAFVVAKPSRMTDTVNPAAARKDPQPTAPCPGGAMKKRRRRPWDLAEHCRVTLHTLADARWDPVTGLCDAAPPGTAPPGIGTIKHLPHKRRTLFPHPNDPEYAHLGFSANSSRFSIPSPQPVERIEEFGDTPRRPHSQKETLTSSERSYRRRRRPISDDVDDDDDDEDDADDNINNVGCVDDDANHDNIALVGDDDNIEKVKVPSQQLPAQILAGAAPAPGPKLSPKSEVQRTPVPETPSESHAAGSLLNVSNSDRKTSPPPLLRCRKIEVSPEVLCEQSQPVLCEASQPTLCDISPLIQPGTSGINIDSGFGEARRVGACDAANLVACTPTQVPISSNAWMPPPPLPQNRSYAQEGEQHVARRLVIDDAEYLGIRADDEDDGTHAADHFDDDVVMPSYVVEGTAVQQTAVPESDDGDPDPRRNDDDSEPDSDMLVSFCPPGDRGLCMLTPNSEIKSGGKSADGGDNTGNRNSQSHALNISGVKALDTLGVETCIPETYQACPPSSLLHALHRVEDDDEAAQPRNGDRRIRAIESSSGATANAPDAACATGCEPEGGVEVKHDHSAARSDSASVDERTRSETNFTPARFGATAIAAARIALGDEWTPGSEFGRQNVLRPSQVNALLNQPVLNEFQTPRRPIGVDHTPSTATAPVVSSSGDRSMAWRAAAAAAAAIADATPRASVRRSVPSPLCDRSIASAVAIPVHARPPSARVESSYADSDAAVEPPMQFCAPNIAALTVLGVRISDDVVDEEVSALQGWKRDGAEAPDEPILSARDEEVTRETGLQMRSLNALVDRESPIASCADDDSMRLDTVPVPEAGHENGTAAMPPHMRPAALLSALLRVKFPQLPTPIPEQRLRFDAASAVAEGSAPTTPVPDLQVPDSARPGVPAASHVGIEVSAGRNLFTPTSCAALQHHSRSSFDGVAVTNLLPINLADDSADRTAPIQSTNKRQQIRPSLPVSSPVSMDELLPPPGAGSAPVTLNLGCIGGYDGSVPQGPNGRYSSAATMPVSKTTPTFASAGKGKLHFPAQDCKGSHPLQPLDGNVIHEMAQTATITARTPLSRGYKAVSEIHVESAFSTAGSMFASDKSLLPKVTGENRHAWDTDYMSKTPATSTPLTGSRELHDKTIWRQQVEINLAMNTPVSTMFTSGRAMLASSTEARDQDQQKQQHQHGSENLASGFNTVFVPPAFTSGLSRAPLVEPDSEQFCPSGAESRKAGHNLATPASAAIAALPTSCSVMMAQSTSDLLNIRGGDFRASAFQPAFTSGAGRPLQLQFSSPEKGQAESNDLFTSASRLPALTPRGQTRSVSFAGKLVFGDGGAAKSFRPCLTPVSGSNPLRTTMGSEFASDCGSDRNDLNARKARHRPPLQSSLVRSANGLGAAPSPTGSAFRTPKNNIRIANTPMPGVAQRRVLPLSGSGGRATGNIGTGSSSMRSKAFKRPRRTLHNIKVVTTPSKATARVPTAPIPSISPTGVLFIASATGSQLASTSRRPGPPLPDRNDLVPSSIQWLHDLAWSSDGLRSSVAYRFPADLLGDDAALGMFPPELTELLSSSPNPGLGVDECEKWTASMFPNVQGKAGTRIGSPAWTRMAYGLAVWKYARLALGALRAGNQHEQAIPAAKKFFSAAHVVREFLRRLSREWTLLRTMPLLKLLRRDASPGLHMVLIVTRLVNVEAKEPVVLELSDGWHVARAILDPALSYLISKYRRLDVGDKIHVSHVVLVPSTNADFFFGNGDELGAQDIRLTINNVRKVSPSQASSARLGIQRGSGLYTCSLASIYSVVRSVIPCIVVVVQRAYPVKFIEKVTTVRKRVRVQGKFGSDDSDDEEVEKICRREQANEEAVERHLKDMEKEREEQHSVRENGEGEHIDRGEYRARDVTAQMEFMVSGISDRADDSDGSALVTVWRPSPEIIDLIKHREGHLLFLFGLRTSSGRKRNYTVDEAGIRAVPLTSGWHDFSKGFPHVFRPRRLTEVRDLFGGELAAGTELDGVFLVLIVGEARQAERVRDWRRHVFLVDAVDHLQVLGLELCGEDARTVPRALRTVQSRGGSGGGGRGQRLMLSGIKRCSQVIVGLRDAKFTGVTDQTGVAGVQATECTEFISWRTLVGSKQGQVKKPEGLTTGMRKAAEDLKIQMDVRGADAQFECMRDAVLAFIKGEKQSIRAFYSPTQSSQVD
jgi:BRCA2, oligonucleotide/oligosaccharide-binding, domain 1